jgi:endonuclease/exonuclease/phosphatase family metal-dependent hydrolase
MKTDPAYLQGRQTIGLPVDGSRFSGTGRHNPRLIRATIIALWVGCLGLTPAAASTQNGHEFPSLRVMSFNVRLSAAADGDNSWPKRMDSFFRRIDEFRPDLIGFQEVLADQYAAMRKNLPGYAFSGVARDDGRTKGEWSLIGYRQDVFQLLDHGDFWLSEHPDVPGSKSWDAALTRLCSWVRLREISSGRELVYANTHFDHIGVIARQEASRLLSRKLSHIAAGVPAILTGDLNTTEDDPPYAILTGPTAAAAIHWIDAYRETHPVRSPDERSFHGFEGGTKGSRIDFIFHTSQFFATGAAIVRTASDDGHFPSDHYPVTAILQLKPARDGRTP